MTIADGRQFFRRTATAYRSIRNHPETNRSNQQYLVACTPASSCRAHTASLPQTQTQTQTLRGTWTTCCCRRSNCSRVPSRAGRLAMPMQCVLAHAARAPARACATRAMPVYLLPHQEGAGASVCYARDASVPSTSPTLGQVAARHLRTRVGRI